MARDVIVVVQRDALPSEKESLDILLVSTTGDYPVGTYRARRVNAPMPRSFARRPPCSIREKPRWLPAS